MMLCAVTTLQIIVSIVYMLILEYFKCLEIESISLKTATMASAPIPLLMFNASMDTYIDSLALLQQMGRVVSEVSCRCFLSPFSGGCMWCQGSQL